MKYYLHDTGAFEDEKVCELFMNFGYEGLGLFYTILEKLAKQEKPIKTVVLKSQLKVGKKLDKCWNFMEQIGIISSNNGDTFNKQLLNYAEKYQIKKEKTAKKVSEWRENQKNIENVTDYENVCNPPKVKESKVNESKVNKGENAPEFGDTIIIMNSDQLREIFSGEIMIDQWCISLNADRNKFRKFLKDWVVQKEISGDFHYTKSKLKSFMLQDWSKFKSSQAFNKLDEKYSKPYCTT